MSCFQQHLQFFKLAVVMSDVPHSAGQGGITFSCMPAFLGQISCERSVQERVTLRKASVAFKSVEHPSDQVLHVEPCHAPRIKCCVQELFTPLISSVACRYELLVEGDDFGSAITTEGVDAARSRINHIMKVEQVLGIEAARITIVDEIKETMSSHGMSIDPRHTTMLADCMTYKASPCLFLFFLLPPPPLTLWMERCGYQHSII